MTTTPLASPYLTTPTFYTILINNVNGFPQAAPNDGFLDNYTVQNYAAINDLNLETGIVGFTLAESESKSKANARYHNLLLQLNRDCNIQVQEYTIGANGVRTSTVVKTGSPNYNVEPTSIQIVVMVERGDPSLQTWDELNPGTLLTGTAALTRFVVRALTSPPTGVGTGVGSDISLKMAVYDPTASAVAGNTTAVPRNGVLVTSLDVGPVVAGSNVVTNYTNAAALVTVASAFSTASNN